MLLRQHTHILESDKPCLKSWGEKMNNSYKSCATLVRLSGFIVANTESILNSIGSK